MAEGPSLLELGGGSSAGLGGVPPLSLNGTDGHPAGYQAAYLYITDNHVTDHQLTTSLWLNTVLGAICFLAFCVLQRSVFPKHYRYRLQSKHVTVKPRKLAEKGLKSLWHWLATALSANEADILRSSGLDAMVMIKALSMGVQIFTPLALIGCAVLLPIHYQHRSLENHDINRSQLMQLTIAALPRGSHLMWVHFVLIILYNFWVMYVLYRKYQEFVIVRQHYLVRGDDPNYWMALTHQAEAQEFALKVQNLLAEVNKSDSKKAMQHREQQAGGNDEPPPPAARSAASPQLTVRESSPSTTSFKNIGSSMVRSWNHMVNSISWRNRPGGLLQQFQRSSFESYKPYTDENTPAASPPVTSPHASSLGGLPLGHSQQPPWGVVRGRGGGGSGGAYTGTSSSDGLDSAGEGSMGDGLGMAAGPVAAAGGSFGGALAVSAGGTDASSTAAAAAAGSLSGGSSRRWSGSSGGASDGGAVAAGRGADGSSGDFSGRRLRIPGKAAGRGSRGGGASAAVMAGGVPPTHQTINELHSMPLHQGAVEALQDAPWPPLMPKHMRTITEDSLEYRLDSSQGNTSRPSSRGGVLSGVGHNRGSSGGTGDFAASPSSVSNSLHCRTPTSALSASLAAAGMGEGSGSLLHRHSHSNSGGSGSGGLGVSSAGVGIAAMSPLSRATSATAAQQQLGAASLAPSRAFSTSSSHQQQPGDSHTPRLSVAADLVSGRGSIESLGPSSVCTRITHNSSGRSSPLDPDDDLDDDVDDGEMYSSSEGDSIEHSNSVHSSSRPHRHAAALAQAARSSRASTASASSTAARDISFGGGLAVSQQDAAAMGLAPEQVYLSGLGDTTTPPASPAAAAAATAGAAAAGQGSVGSRHIRHGYETSVDFSALHLEDLSRAETPLSPEDGGLLSPEPIGNRRRRVAADSGANGGRWSPFANCEQIASNIAAQGVAGEDFWSVGVERVQGVHSNPALAAQQGAAAAAPAAAAAAAARGSAGGQGQLMGSQDSNKQRFLRPGPGWQPPAPGAAASSQQAPIRADGSQGQQQQQQQQQQAEQDMPRQLSSVVQQQQPAAGASYIAGSAVAGASIGSGGRSSASTNSLHARSAGRLGSSSQDGPAAQGQQQRGGSSEPSSSGHTTRAGSSSGLGQTGRPQRTRVGVPWASMSSAGGAGGSGRNSSEPSPSPQQHHSWLHGGWQHQSWQAGSRGTGSSAATSNSNSHMVSPFASTFTTPRGDAAVAGAAVGSGLELTAAAVAAASGSAAEQYAAAAAAAPGSAAPGEMLASGVAERMQELGMLDAGACEGDAAGQGLCRADGSKPIAFNWWETIPKPMRKNQSASCLEQLGNPDGRMLNQQVWAADNQNDDDAPLLAKPSVRFRKTINTVFVPKDNPKQPRVVAVNAQHYAVLVTDVKQWPYPEMQWEYEAARRRTLYHRAWDWFITKLSTVPQSISWGLLPGPDFHFVQHKKPQHEQQHLLEDHTAEQPFDKHCLELQQLQRGAAGTAFGSSIAGAASAAAVNTSGGASVPSRGQAGRGQMSSCATSSEGIGGGAAAGMLARISMASHASHMSHVVDLQSMDPDDLLMTAEDKLAAARQQVLQSMDESNSSGAQRSNSEAERNLAKIEKAQAEWHRIAQERERQHALSREHSYLHLAPTSRTTSYMRLGAAGGYNPAAYSGAASLMTASRASSFRSMRLRGDAVLGGAAGGTADWSHRGGAGGASGCPTAAQCSRAQTPASAQESSEAGSYSAGLAAAAGGGAAMPLTSASAGGISGVSGAAPPAGRLTDPLVQHQRHSSLRMQGLPVGSPRMLEANDADVALHMYRAGGSAPAAGTPHTGLAAAAAAVAAAVAANERASQGGGPPAVGLDQALSEPLTSASMQEPRPLQQQLSQPSLQHVDAAGAATAAAVASVPPDAAAAARGGSSGSHGMLLGELSLEQPLPQSAAAQPGGTGEAAAPAAAGSDEQGRSTAKVSSSAAAGTAAPASPFGLHSHRRYVHRSVSPSGASPDLDAASTPSLGSTDKGLWVNIPASPRTGEQQSGWDSAAASAAATPAAAAAAGVTAAALGAGTGAPAGGAAAASAAVAAPAAPYSRSTGGGAYATATGVTDSYDSNASSYAARRPVGSCRPYPPDSPRALQQQQQLQQQGLVGLSQRELMSSSYRTSPVAGAAIGGHVRAYRSFASGGHHGNDTAAASAAASRMGSYAPGSGHPSYGSSGGGMVPAGAAGTGSSTGGAYLAAALAAGRSRSGRLSSSQADGHHGLCHPEHLSLLIPPMQQHPLSRVGTPCGSGGGFGGSGGGLPGSGGGAMGVPVMPMQQGPWGLPADAALLSSSASVTAAGSPGAMMAMRSRAGLGSAASQHHLLGRWSVPGGPGAPGEERSKSNLPMHSHTVSPLNSDQDGLIPAGVLGNQGSGFSRAASGASSEAGVPGNYVAAAGSKDPAVGLLAAPVSEGQDGGYHKFNGWARVRQAFENKELPKLLENKDTYSIVTATFKRLFPNDFDTAIPVINHKKVDALLMQWEAAIAERERAALKEARTRREPMHFSGKLGSLLNCCTACGCAGCPDATELCGSCCPQHVVPVIPEIEERIKELEVQIEAARRNAFTSEFTPSWFVLFKTQQAATMAASTRIYAEDSTEFQVHPAPGPEEVNWQHLWMTWRERDCRTVLTWPLMLLVVLFPITLITSAASRLEYVFCPQVDQGQPTPAFVWEWYCSGRDAGESLPTFMRALITGWLPSLLLNLWLVMVLPRLVYLLVQTEGSCFSLSALERRIGAVFFYWDIFNVFLQGLIGSTFFQQVHKIIQSPAQLPNILGAALPDSSNFFMQFIAMRALFLIWLRMCVPHGGVWQNWCHFCWCASCCCSTCNTGRDQSLTYGPRTPRYGFEMGHILLMYLIALAFAIVSPMLLPFSVVWFAFAWVAWRHNLSYVYQRKYESGGLMWIFLFSRIVMCLVIGQMFTFCVLVVRGAYWQAFLIVAFMPAITARYFKYCQARFARGVELLPLDLANIAPRARVPPLAYIPPPLQASSWGWYPEWQKIWDGWGMPAYSL